MLESTLYWQHVVSPLSTSPAWNVNFRPPPACKTTYPVLSMPTSNSQLGIMASDYLMPEMFDDDEAQVKRPMNSFLLWAKIMRKKFAKDYPNLHNAEISKLLGKVWNGMSTSEKRPFVEKAEKLRVLHMRDHPNYRYAPKKKKEKRAAQRMIPPEVAAAFHNALFDLKGAKEVPGGTDYTNNNSEDLHEGASYSALLKRGFKGSAVNAEPFKSGTTSPFDGLKVPSECRPVQYEPTDRSFVDGQGSPLVSINDTELPRVTDGRYIGSSKTEKVYRFQNFSTINPYQATKSVPRHQQTTENLDQVTPSSPQEQSDTLGYVMNEENFYSAAMDYPLSRVLFTQNQDYDTLGGSDGTYSAPGTPESGYEDEVPPFLRALLERPIHMDQPKVPQVTDREDDDILHDLGEIISKELGCERKACLYS